MSDRVSASISIGGTVTRDQWAVLLELIAEQDLRTEWDGPAFAAATPRDSAALHLFAHEVPWGVSRHSNNMPVTSASPIVAGQVAFPAASGRKSSCLMGVAVP